jgi:hypothetical protein
VASRGHAQRVTAAVLLLSKGTRRNLPTLLDYSIPDDRRTLRGRLASYNSSSTVVLSEEPHNLFAAPLRQMWEGRERKENSCYSEATAHADLLQRFSFNLLVVTVCRVKRTDVCPMTPWSINKKRIFSLSVCTHEANALASPLFTSYCCTIRVSYKAPWFTQNQAARLSSIVRRRKQDGGCRDRIASRQSPWGFRWCCLLYMHGAVLINQKCVNYVVRLRRSIPVLACTQLHTHTGASWLLAS